MQLLIRDARYSIHENESNIVDVYISRIRAKLRLLPGGEDFVASIRGHGWKLRAPA